MKKQNKRIFAKAFSGFSYAVKITLSMIFLSSISNLQAQHLSESEVLAATAYFAEGQYDETIELLEAKKIKRLSENMKQRTLKLLSASYYEIDEIEKSDSTTKIFLKEFPLYKEDNTSDPEAFILGLERFYVKPKLSLSFKISLNNTMPGIQNKYQLSDSVDYTQPYTESNGIGGQLSLERYLFYNLSLQLGIEVKSMSYSRIITYKNRQNANFTLNDQMLRISTPLSLIYTTRVKDFSISPFAGVASVYNLSNVSAEYLGESISVANNSRSEINAQFFWGLRLGWQKSNVEFFVDYSRYADQILHTISPYEADLYYPYMYVDDDFYLTGGQFSAGASIRLTYKVFNKYD